MQNKPFHLAFKVDYPCVVRELRTEVLIALPQMLDKNINKKGVKVQALWDTGATCTAISSNIVNALGLKPVDKAENYTAAGKRVVDVYYIDIILPNRVRIQDVKVTECILADFDVLIGMDIISMGDFAISNGNGKTHFSYCIPPHKNPICLYEKSQKVNPKIIR